MDKLRLPDVQKENEYSALRLTWVILVGNAIIMITNVLLSYLHVYQYVEQKPVLIFTVIYCVSLDILAVYELAFHGRDNPIMKYLLITVMIFSATWLFYAYDIRCMKECIDVGHAAGAEFAPVQGKNITKLFYYTNAAKRTFGEILLPIAMKKHRLLEPSMLQDLKKKKPCEVDAINGVVCDWGKKCGVPTPINDRIVEIIKKEQNGELPLSKANIDLFDDLLRTVK